VNVGSCKRGVSDGARVTRRHGLGDKLKGLAYVQADIGIDQRFLGGGDALDNELGINGGAALHQAQGNGPKFEVPRRATNEADSTPIKLQLSSRSWQRIDTAVQV
jgi:hypothetical protein